MAQAADLRLPRASRRSKRLGHYGDHAQHIGAERMIAFELNVRKLLANRVQTAPLREQFPGNVLRQRHNGGCRDRGGACRRSPRRTRPSGRAPPRSTSRSRNRWRGPPRRPRPGREPRPGRRPRPAPAAWISSSTVDRRLASTVYERGRVQPPLHARCCNLPK